jgi:hypothetical protein
MKLTKDQIKEIRESDKRQVELAQQFKVHPNTIRYYRSEEFRDYLREYNRERYGKMNKEQKEEYFKKKREYQREYQNKKYREDKEFREKHLERVKKKYQKEKK